MTLWGRQCQVVVASGSRTESRGSDLGTPVQPFGPRLPINNKNSQPKCAFND